MQAMLVTLDRKSRLASEIAAERDWRARSVSRLLVLPSDRTARRRIQTHRATLDAVLPARTLEVRHWLQAPSGTIRGVLFLPNDTQPGTRHRVGNQKAGT